MNYCQSVNGPEVTLIEGYQMPGTTNGNAAIRCVYLTTNAVLNGFTLTNGATDIVSDWPFDRSSNGGGVWCESFDALITNCILRGNSAYDSGGGAFGGTLSNCTVIDNHAGIYGGGTYYGTLNGCVLSNNCAEGGGGANESTLQSCLLIGNSASWGGGASDSILNDCTLSGNSAVLGGGGAAYSTLYNCLLTSNTTERFGGGAHLCTLCNCTLCANSAAESGGGAQGGTDPCELFNCIVYGNTAPQRPNIGAYCSVNYSCTYPLPTTGIGNITNAPAFRNSAAGDYYLAYGSPCIDAGTNLSAIITNDLEGHLRSLDGNGDGIAASDMGAYEFDLRTVVPTNWFTQYGLDPADPHVVSGNPDGDPFTTFQEWQADTDPTNTLSHFRIEVISNGPPVAVYFTSSSNRVYSLINSTNLSAFDWIEVPGQTAVPGSGGMDILTDTNPAPHQFYRISVDVRP